MVDTSGGEEPDPQNRKMRCAVCGLPLPCLRLSGMPPDGSIHRAGWPWRLLARAPTDPYVLALEHTVPQPADSPPAWDPEAIRSSYGDMAWTLDGFRMVPSIESAGRRSASLHRVLRGEFPCFIGTIKALRLPAALPAALRFLSLETSSVVFSCFGGMPAPLFCKRDRRPCLDTIQRSHLASTDSF